MIVYLVDGAGAITAGDTASGLANYAYPSSPWAQMARRDPAGVAAEMIAEAKRVAPAVAGFPHIVERYNARLWAALQAGGVVPQDVRK